MLLGSAAGEDPVLEQLREIGRAFGIPGTFRDAVRHGRGHIHDTFVARYEERGTLRRYVHQRLNTYVFRDPEALMSNLERITGHLRGKLAETADAERRCLRLLAAEGGRCFHRDAEGSYWRTTPFVEDSRSLDRLGSAAEATEAGRAFGRFAELLADLGPPPLAETIPRFHDLGARHAALEAAARADRVGRAGGVAAELDAARALHARIQEALAGSGPLPRRLVHNDCKVDNLLFDAHSGEALCVLDLDTVMEGTLLSDFGELVRSGACRGAEDERDAARLDFDLELFAALARGYLEGARLGSEAAELAVLHLAGAALSLENGIRFLSDHLDGDRYFRVQRDAQNLDRARAQLGLARRIWEQRDAARGLLERVSRELPA